MDTGVVYLVHFDKPYKHAKHYIGWTENLDARLACHADGAGARLLAVVAEAGIGWTLARTWPGGRGRERQIKRQGGASRVCPVCGVKPTLAAPPVQVTLHKVAPWAKGTQDSRLRRTRREWFTRFAGRHYRVSSTRPGGRWRLEEIDVQGNRKTLVSAGMPTLASARQAIADLASGMSPGEVARRALRAPAAHTGRAARIHRERGAA